MSADRTHPVFDAGDIPALLHVVEELSAATRTIGLVAQSIERSLAIARQNLQRADAIARPPQPAPIQSLRAQSKGAIGEGGFRILTTLLLTFPLPMQKAVLFQKLEYKASTVRTYIPALRQAGYIVDDQFNARLTADGVAFIDAQKRRAA